MCSGKKLQTPTAGRQDDVAVMTEELRMTMLYPPIIHKWRLNIEDVEFLGANFFLEQKVVHVFY